MLQLLNARGNYSCNIRLLCAAGAGERGAAQLHQGRAGPLNTEKGELPQALLRELCKVLQMMVLDYMLMPVLRRVLTFVGWSAQCTAAV